MSNMSAIKQEPTEDAAPYPEYYQRFSYKVKVEVDSDSLLKAGIDLDCLAGDFKVEDSQGHSTVATEILTKHAYPMFEDLMKRCVASCKFCPKRFMNRYSLLKHNLNHAEIKLCPTIYQCHYCNKIFTQKFPLVKHLATQHRKLQMSTKPITKSFVQCIYCKKSYKYKVWHEHVRTVHNNGQKSNWKCHVCDKMFKCEKNLTRHNAYLHSDEKPKWMQKRQKEKNTYDNWQCPYCPKVFKNRDCVNHHVNNVHSGGKPFKCNICSSMLKSEPYLKTHMRRVHYDDGKLHDCNVCGNIFKSPRYLRIHQRNSHH